MAQQNMGQMAQGGQMGGMNAMAMNGNSYYMAQNGMMDPSQMVHSEQINSSYQ